MNRKENLESIFNPTSVAIAGVAPGNLGQAFLDSLLDSGFQGRVYPLNPKGGEVSGVKVYANIKDVPEPVDYVICCIPAPAVPQLIKDCAAKGVKVVSIYTAGFSESGSREGKQLEIEVCHLAQASGIRILGPNCLGVYHPEVGLSYASDFPKERGEVALICQSGGSIIYLIRAAALRGVRFSKAISYGNACDIDESELLEYFTKDVETKIIASYIEGVKDGQRFHRVLKELSATKPVIILKAGYTPAGARAVASHTGALAGSNEVWDRLLQQAGAIRVYDLEELVDMMVTFSYLSLPKGRRVATCGGGGGFNVLATDGHAEAGFILPPLPQQLQKEISQEIRNFVKTDAGMILNNPFDITNIASGEGHYAILKRLADYKGFDLLVTHLSINNSEWPYVGASYNIWPDIFTDATIKVHHEVGKPTAVVIHGILSTRDLQRTLELQQKCCDAGLPVYHSIKSAAKAIDRFLRYHEKRLASARKGC